MLNEPPHIGFIGAGTVGLTLARRLRDGGFPVVAAASRTRESAERLAAAVAGCRAVGTADEVAALSDLVFITTPDDQIAAVAAATHWRDGQAAVHCSGARSSRILGPARASGAVVGVFHPLQTFATAEAALCRLQGITYTIETEDDGLFSILARVATALGGYSIRLNAEDHVLYHISAVLTSNYVVTLTSLAASLWAELGVDRDHAIRALVPLLHGAVDNIDVLGLPNSLTGPIARGDSGTVEEHVHALAGRFPDLLEVYRELARLTIPVALERGHLSREQAETIQKLLAQAPDRA